MSDDVDTFVLCELLWLVFLYALPYLKIINQAPQTARDSYYGL